MEGRAPAARRHALLRVLGLAFGVAVTMGGTIGVGILRAPGPVAAHLSGSGNSFILAVWLLGGLYLFVSAISVAELATMLPAAGGFYVYTRRAFGDAVGFTAGWVDWLTQASALAYLGISMAEFAAALWPVLARWTTEGAIGLIAALTLLQWRGTRVSGRTQEIACVVQACGYFLFVAACFTFAGSTAPPATSVSRAHAAALWIPVLVAIRLIVATFDGWYSVIYFTEEVREPSRNLPRSLIGGVVAITVVYTLFNAALLRVLPANGLAGMTLPAADAAAALFGENGRRMATILCLISLPAAFNSALLCATRISFAMSRDDLFLAGANRVNSRGTPVTAMALSAAAAVALSVSGTFEQLLTWVGVLNGATYCAALASLLLLRRREPGLERPFSARPYPWMTLLALAGGMVLLIGAGVGDPKSTLQGLGLVAAGYPVYRLSRWLRRAT